MYGYRLRGRASALILHGDTCGLEIHEQLQGTNCPSRVQERNGRSLMVRYAESGAQAQMEFIHVVAGATIDFIAAASQKV
jgi:hypothetical protein